MFSTTTACLALASPVAPCVAQSPDAVVAPSLSLREALISVERIWDRAPHSAFTDLIRHEGRWICAFREGSGHVPGTNGVVRIIATDDAMNWKSIALLDAEGVDLRDPKLSVMPSGRILVTMGGSVYAGHEIERRDPYVSFIGTSPTAPHSYSVTTPIPVALDESIRTDNDWLWRVTWHGSFGYGVVYQAAKNEWHVHLVRTRDGIAYEHVASLQLDGRPNETTLRFDRTGRMIALVRRESGDRSAMIGTSTPPFTDWSWSTLDEHVGGPNLIQLKDGSWLVGGRRHTDSGPRTHLGRVDVATGAYEILLDLPSAGDTSYPGLVLHDGRLHVSYYSTHESRTSIYRATLRESALTNRR